MDELEKRLKEVKKELRPMNLVSIVAVISVIVGAVLVIVGVALKDNKYDAMFGSGIGIVATVIVLHLTACIVNRKGISEQYRLQKQIRAKKKESK